MEKGVLQKLPLALTGGFSLFLTLDAGLLIMLALAHFLENATAGALPLKPFERTFQGLIFADTYLGHCYPSPRSRTMDDRGAKPHSEKPQSNYTAKEAMRQLFSQNRTESGHPVSQLCPSENMKMKMGNGLAGIGAAVGDDAITACKTFLGGDDRNGPEAFGQVPVRETGGIIQRGDVLLRDDQHMRRRLGIDIPESVDILVFIDFGRRDLSLHDFTEEAVFHFDNILSQIYNISPRIPRDSTAVSLIPAGTPAEH